MERDFTKNPYTPEERRVADFFSDLGLGGGDDPIGAMIASYRYVHLRSNKMWKHCTIICWPKDGGYPLEHSLHADRNMRSQIEAEIANRE